VKDSSDGSLIKRKDAIMEKIEIEVAKDIWEICKKSPEHGNAVMDVIGEEAYQRVMELQSKE